MLPRRSSPVRTWPRISARPCPPTLANWLDSLPKPAAVMAVHDLRATHVLEAASLRKIKVPEQLAVIGVDNDELLCDFTTPQLTSISPDHVKEGELATPLPTLDGTTAFEFSAGLKNGAPCVVDILKEYLGQ